MTANTPLAVVGSLLLLIMELSNFLIFKCVGAAIFTSVFIINTSSRVVGHYYYFSTPVFFQIFLGKKQINVQGCKLLDCKKTMMNKKMSYNFIQREKNFLRRLTPF